MSCIEEKVERKTFGVFHNSTRHLFLYYKISFTYIPSAKREFTIEYQFPLQENHYWPKLCTPIMIVLERKGVIFELKKMERSQRRYRIFHQRQFPFLEGRNIFIRGENIFCNLFHNQHNVQL